MKRVIKFCGCSVQESEDYDDGKAGMSVVYVPYDCNGCSLNKGDYYSSPNFPKKPAKMLPHPLDVPRNEVKDRKNGKTDKNGLRRLA
jgi:hypothetical protein